jgi:hypothetical protein
MAQRTARTSALLAVPTAWLSALAVETSLARLGFERTLRWIERVPPRRFSFRRRLSVVETKRVVAVAYRLQPFEGRCLSRSLVEYILHRRSGAGVRFVVGIRRPEGTDVGPDLEAHAWVEEPASSAPDGETFTELLVATTPARR